MNATNTIGVIEEEHKENVYYHSLPLPLIIIFAIFAFVINSLTILGNLLVLRFKARVGRTNTTLLVWNLGLTDFLVGIIVLPLAAIHLLNHGKWLFGRALCRIWVAADVTFCTCSVVTICIISVDRYLAVTRPLQYKSFVTKIKVIFVIILIWVFSSTVLLATVRWKQSEFHDEGMCFAGNEIRYLAHSVVFAFFLPASVTLTLYWRIYKLARNRQRALDRGFLMILGHNMNFLTNTLSQATALRVHIGPNNGMVEHQRRVLRTHERIAKTLGVVSCSFLFCWLPFFTLYLTNYNCKGCVSTIAIDMTSWLGYCNSMLNPIIYSFTVKEFKRSTVRTIVPVWNFLHSLFPNRISKPSQNCSRIITRNIANKTRKNRLPHTSNRSKWNQQRHRQCSSNLSLPYNSEVTRGNSSSEKCLRKNCMKSKLGISTNSLQNKLFRDNGKNNNLSETLKNESVTDYYNNTTAISFISKSRSTLSSSSSLSSTQMIMKMPCRMELRQKRHSSPALIGLSSSFFKKQASMRKNRQTTNYYRERVTISKSNALLTHATQVCSRLLTNSKRVNQTRSFNAKKEKIFSKSQSFKERKFRNRIDIDDQTLPKQYRKNSAKIIIENENNLSYRKSVSEAETNKESFINGKPVLNNQQIIPYEINQKEHKTIDGENISNNNSTKNNYSVRVYCLTKETDL